ncbi:protein FON2 SPARE1-like [Hibiscus syriacus]|uniref:Protein FON2 SPARE1-like n=1 Tax=Hibiscus syriacus TaxID=106335 RepID=A0A6A3DBP9_HIBSY|nr:oleosin-like [Hibiscus syriacus]KAE8736479.1 protein FON2 SPARE1-like [Hibiscus syriacus]
MAERSPRQRRSPRPNPTATTFLQRIQAHAPNSAQLPLFVTASILLIFTGVTVTVASLGFILLMPLILISSPIWFPVGSVLLIVSAGFFSACGFGVLSVAGLCWMFRYFRGMHPPGSDRVDYARSRIYDTASHVKDYAIEYGGYLQSKVKDAAPGA